MVVLGTRWLVLLGPPLSTRPKAHGTGESSDVGMVQSTLYATTYVPIHR